LPQKAEHPRNGQPVCPDCLGTGDLRRRIGTIADTTTFLSGPANADVLNAPSDGSFWRGLRRAFLRTPKRQGVGHAGLGRTSHGS
jgi:hypothetical protein